MAFERVEVRGPDLPERRQPGVDFLQWSGCQSIETPLRIDGGFDEAGFTQHAQMLGHGRLCYPELALDGADRLFGRDEQAQNRAPVGFGNDLENGWHR